jgi:predicted dehydrogenase
VIRVALIGCGLIARAEHLPAWRGCAEAGLCELVGVCDAVHERALALGSEFGAPVFASVEEMLERARPEVVDIATSVPGHRALALQAFDAGCHVLCEKPVATSLDEAQAMVRAAERAGRLLSICFQYRHWDESEYLRRRIAAGDFGHVHAVRTFGGAEHNFPVHRHALAHRGVISHWTIHNLDLVLWLLGNPEPLTASAFAWQRLRAWPSALGLPPGESVDEVHPHIEDFGAAMLRLEGETVVTLEANWLQAPSPRPEGWELLGDRGNASLSPIRVMLDRDGEWVEDTPPAGSLEACTYRMDRLMTRFLAAVRDGTPAPVGPEEILRIQRAMDALYLSVDLGREVSLDREGA